jgi:cysteine-rich repeat protein
VTRKVVLALALAPLACSGEGTSEVPPGLEVLVRYDSSLAVAEFKVAALKEDGGPLWAPESRPAPLFLDPPGPREAPLAFPRPDAAAVVVLVDGLDGAGAVVGSGQATLQLPAEGAAQVAVTLGPPVTCGDGVLTGREGCDDGDREGGDGCGALCTVEAGWSCAGAPSVCGRCGDGVRQAGEACDDGGNEAGDGCSPACEVEGEVRPYLVEAEALAELAAEGEGWTPVEGARLSLDPLPPGERWVVFASGVLGSSSASEQAALGALFVDDAEVSRFGHQTFGGDGRGAGFVTFWPLDPGAGAEVSLAIAAVEGVTTVSQARLVGLRVPAGVPLFAGQGEDAEVQGIDVALFDLDLRVEARGRYLVLGQGTLTESPGADTARIWMQTPAGRTPWDGRGVSFSSPRDAEVPFFAAQVLTLDAGDHTVGLRGTSSGAGAIDGWWSGLYPFRRRITVSAGTAAVPETYAVPITFDHAAQVAAGRARADGEDVRVVHGDGIELTRAVDPARGWGRNDTTVWVALPQGLAAGETAGDLWLYFGAGAAAGPAPQEPARVFPLFDGFEGSTLAPWWEGAVSTPPQGGLLTLGPGELLVARGPPPQANLPSVLVEARLRYEDPANSPTVSLGVGGAADGTGRGGAYFGTLEGRHLYGAGGVVTAYEADTPERFHRYGLGLLGTEISFQVDAQELSRLPALTAGDTVAALTLQNGGQSALVYDWVRARLVVEPEPTVQLEPTTGPAGLRPSRYTHLRLLAISLDALGEVFEAAEPGPVSTTESATVSLVKLQVPGAAAPREHLVLMSTRVAGASSERGRKEGLCLVDGQAILRTDHRINRDDADATGYHHVAGVVDARTTAAPANYATAIRSPDGIRVEGAASAAVVVRF